MDVLDTATFKNGSRVHCLILRIGDFYDDPGLYTQQHPINVILNLTSIMHQMCLRIICVCVCVH